MGRAKQLLAYQGSTLVGHAVTIALQVLDPVVVVVGAYSQDVCAAITTAASMRPVQVIENFNWEAGLASSISAGIKYLVDHSTVDGAMLLAADQPFVTIDHLWAMCLRFSNRGAEVPPDIVAAEYGGTLGIPAVFGKHLFPQLLTLTGDQGARSLLQDVALRVTPFPCPEAALDIDTPEDAGALS
jgi:molybdenum cofactor cytidylyltransferase